VIRINLAPPQSRKGAGLRSRMPSVNLGLVVLVVYALAGAGIGLYWLQLSREETRLTQEIGKANQDLATLRPITSQVQKVKDQLADLQKRVKTIEEITKDQSKPIRIFDAVASIVPNDVWITKMEERGSMVKVTGTAFSATAVSDLMSNLRASGKFKEVDIVISRQDLTKATRLVTFEVTCRFEG
jgi:type IV pilus assembly protein PilN